MFYNDIDIDIQMILIFGCAFFSFFFFLGDKF